VNSEIWEVQRRKQNAISSMRVPIRCLLFSAMLASVATLRITRAQLISSTVAAAPLAAWAVPLPVYDDDGQLLQANGYSEETAFRTLRSGVASMRVLDAWKARQGGGFDDPVLGSAAESVRMSVTATSAASTADLGRPERLQLVKTLGLEPELERADLVAAAVRQADGVTFYDFDLALPALKCVPELATACLPEQVVLLSCGVRDGNLHLARVDATADQWRRAGKALRDLRSSFAVDAAETLRETN
jgi:hypothetical protein